MSYNSKRIATSLANYRLLTDPQRSSDPSSTSLFVSKENRSNETKQSGKRQRKTNKKPSKRQKLPPPDYVPTSLPEICNEVEYSTSESDDSDDLFSLGKINKKFSASVTETEYRDYETPSNEETTLTLDINHPEWVLRASEAYAAEYKSNEILHEQTKPQWSTKSSKFIPNTSTLSTYKWCVTEYVGTKY